MCLGKCTWGFAGPLVLKTQEILFRWKQNEGRVSHLSSAACENLQENLEWNVSFPKTTILVERQFLMAPAWNGNLIVSVENGYRRSSPILAPMSKFS